MRRKIKSVSKIHLKEVLKRWNFKIGGKEVKGIIYENFSEVRKT